MRELWKGEEDTCPCCRADLRTVGVWTDEAKRKALAPGQVYLVFSGDPDVPFAFVKIICFDGDCLRVKLFRDHFAERPPSFEPDRMLGGSGIAPASVDMLFAWGPPEFPELVAQEAVTVEELDRRNWLP